MRGLRKRKKNQFGVKTVPGHTFKACNEEEAGG